jgi:hypothetical protein
MSFTLLLDHSTRKCATKPSFNRVFERDLIAYFELDFPLVCTALFTALKRQVVGFQRDTAFFADFYLAFLKVLVTKINYLLVHSYRHLKVLFIDNTYAYPFKGTSPTVSRQDLLSHVCYN